MRRENGTEESLGYDSVICQNDAQNKTMQSTVTRGKRILKKIPLAGPALTRIYRRLYYRKFNNRNFDEFDSKDFWKARYREGGHSGAGSYGRLAQFKAEVLNKFVSEHGVQNVIEFGSGDGNQLSLAQYPCYIGFDPSPEAIERCRERFAQDSNKTFHLLDVEFVPGECRAELVLSLDVIYHLVEDSVFDAHMRHLFCAAERYVIIYSDDTERPSSSVHVRHRRFSGWIAAYRPGWRLIKHIPNRYQYSEEHPADTSFADFWIYSSE
jgi:hypothetical protein